MGERHHILIKVDARQSIGIRERLRQDHHDRAVSEVAGPGLVHLIGLRLVLVVDLPHGLLAVALGSVHRLDMGKTRECGERTPCLSIT